MNILKDGSVEGQTFSGKEYKGEFPTPKNGETYREFYKRCQEAKELGFHLGDLSWGDWHTYCLGSPEGGGQYVQDYVIGEVPEDQWVEDRIDDENDY